MKESPPEKGVKLNLFVLIAEHLRAKLILSQNSQVGVALRKAKWLG